MQHLRRWQLQHGHRWWCKRGNNLQELPSGILSGRSGSGVLHGLCRWPCARNQCGQRAVQRLHQWHVQCGHDKPHQCRQPLQIMPRCVLHGAARIADIAARRRRPFFSSPVADPLRHLPPLVPSLLGTAGYFQAARGETECSSCTPGRFQDENGGASCDDCSEKGFFCPAGSAKRVRVSDGYYSVEIRARESGELLDDNMVPNLDALEIEVHDGVRTAQVASTTTPRHTPRGPLANTSTILTPHPGVRAGRCCRATHRDFAKLASFVPLQMPCVVSGSSVQQACETATSHDVCPSPATSELASHRHVLLPMEQAMCVQNQAWSTARHVERRRMRSPTLYSLRTAVRNRHNSRPKEAGVRLVQCVASAIRSTMVTLTLRSRWPI